MTSFFRKGRTGFALLVAPVLLLGLGACGGTVPDADPGKDTKASTAAAKTMQDWSLDYASCMRGEGFDMPDPSSNGVAEMPQFDDDSGVMAAHETCVKKIGTAPVQTGGKSKEGMQEAQRKIAQCLRDQGVDIEDPKPGMGMALPEVSEQVMAACGLGAKGRS
jgi:hypothetical protein